MEAFRFRAAAALDLRRRQEQHAETALAQAEAALSAVRTRLTDARDRVVAAGDTLAAAATTGTTADEYAWHRNWITGLMAVVDVHARDVESHAGAVERARLAWQQARRQRLTLERLRERAWRRYQRERERQEMKAIDEVARARFTTGLAGQEERNDL